MVGKNARKCRFIKKELPNILKRKQQDRKFDKLKAKKRLRKASRKSEKRDSDISDDPVNDHVQETEIDDLGQEDVLDPLDDDAQSETSSSILSSHISEDEFKDLDVDQRRKIVNEQIRAHKEELLKIKENDPVYYQYLLENDNSLLEFVNEEEFIESEQQSPTTGAPPVQDDTNRDKTDLVVWKRMLIATKQLKTLKRALIKLRTTLSSCMESKEGNQIPDTKQLTKIVSLCIKTAPIVFNYHLLGKEEASAREIIRAMKKPAWRKIKPMVKSYITSVFNVLKFLTDNTIQCYVVASLIPSAPYFNSYSTKQKKLINIISHIWRSGDDRLAVRAFLLMKYMSAEINTEVAELIMSSMLLYYQEGSVIGPSGNTLLNDDRTRFMINSITEIFASNTVVAHKKIFQSIRNLAVTLRNCITKTSANSHNELYQWKTIKKIYLLANILKFCNKNNLNIHSLKDPLKSTGELGQLVYPFVQVCLGIIRLRPPGEYTPLHLHIIQCLIDISEQTLVFIPLSPYLFNALETSDMLSFGKPSMAKPIDFTSVYKTPKDILGTKQYNKLLANKVFSMLIKYFSIHSNSISFPELSVAPISYAKNIIKQTSNLEVKKNLNIFVSKMEDNAEFIQKKRSGVDFGPRDVSQTVFNYVQPNLTSITHV